MVWIVLASGHPVMTLAGLNRDRNVDLILDDAPFQVGGVFGVYFAAGNGDGPFGAPWTVVSNLIVSQILPAISITTAYPT